MGEGIVHAGDGGVFLLYVDVGDDTMHVDRVRRA